MFGNPKNKEIKRLEKEIDELEDAIYFSHNEDDIEEDTYQLHKKQKQLEKLKGGKN